MTVRYLQEDVHIKCYVHADPEIDQFRIYWAPMSPTIGNITLEGNSSDGLYHAHVENGVRIIWFIIVSFSLYLLLSPCISICII